MRQIKSVEEFYEVVEQDRNVLVYFYTNWCPDCFAVRPFLPKLDKEFMDLEFVKMDRDVSIDLARHLNIFGIPSFIIFNKGEEKGRFVSKLRKSYDEVRTFIVDTLNQ